MRPLNGVGKAGARVLVGVFFGAAVRAACQAEQEKVRAAVLLGAGAADTARLDPRLLLPDPDLMASPEGDRRGLAELRTAAEAEIAASQAEFAVDALRLIGWYGCEHFTGRHSCRDAGSGKTRNAYYGGEMWCDACVALNALGIAPGVRPRDDGWYGLDYPQRIKGTTD